MYVFVGTSQECPSALKLPQPGMFLVGVCLFIRHDGMQPGGYGHLENK
jgi:hypothetical protein